MKKPANDHPRLLILDIETRLVPVWTFGIRDQHITHKQIADLEDSGRNIHCVGLKWHGERKTTVLSEWEHGYEGMIRGVFDAVNEADALITFNGVSFDWPKLKGQFMLLELGLPKPPTHIDIFKTTRKMGFISSKLDYIAPLLGLGSKVKHPGLEMWIACREGCPKAQAKMARYCAGDVRLTEAVYDRVRPYCEDHPRVGNRHGFTCPNCGGEHLTSQGYKVTRTTRVQSLKCSACGSWTQGKRERIAA